MKRIILFSVFFLFLIFKNQAQTVIDYDGNVYNTVTIGTQVWMRENLKVAHYNNGDTIENITDNTIWNNLTKSAFCNYVNSEVSATIWGRLYNWYAVNDNRKIAPEGWHVATDSEWNIMEKFLDNSVDTAISGWTGTDIGGQLKMTGTEYWGDPNTGATNSSGFFALPAGYRGLNGTFLGERTSGNWWTATNNTTGAWKRYLSNTSSQVYRYTDYMKYGFSVRCVKNSITGIEDIYNKNKIQIYPNPAIDKLIINCGDRQEVQLKIFNMMGDCLMQNILTDGTNDIDIIFLSRGIYVIKFFGINWTEQFRLIKE
jgi:uncharacterized protein (TIGR02145 family)